MELKKFNPWNWFKHEESGGGNIPVRRNKEHKHLPVANNDTWLPMLRMHQDIDRLFEDVFRNFGSPLLGTEADFVNASFMPDVNVSSDDNNYHVSLEIPGLTQSDVEVEVRDDKLIIKGHKEEENESKKRHFYRIERSYGSFQRILSLPEDANSDEIKANMKNGVLDLTIPRIDVVEDKDKVKRISINS